jgi:hypothetical protein
MAGVTHFERRGRPKKVHPSCPFCKQVRQVTTRRIVQAGGAKRFIAFWAEHIAMCTVSVYDSVPDQLRRAVIAAEHMASFGATVWGNV